MAFNLSGTTITQTEIDVDLSGLQAIAGVNYFSLPNGKSVYDLNTGNLKLSVSGDLQIDGDVEELHCNASSARSLQVNSGAVLRVGKLKTSGGVTRYSQGLSIVQGYVGEGKQHDPEGIVFLNSSDFQWNGGVIMSANAMGAVTNQTNVTATINAGTFIVTAPSNNAMFFRSDGTPDKIVVNSVVLDSLDPLTNGAVIFARNGLDTISFDMRAGFIQERSGSSTGVLLVRGGKFAKNAYLHDYEFNGSGLTNSNGSEFVNLDVGTDIRFDAGSVMTSTDTGHVSIFQELDVTVKDLDSTAIESAKIYIPTTDSGNRNDLSAGSVRLQNGRTFGGGVTTYNLYEAVSDASGIFPTQTILTGRFWKESGTLSIEQDLYSVAQTAGDETFSVSFASYNHLFALENKSLRGSEPVTIERTLLDDTSISETDKAIVDAYTVIDSSYQLYDRAKSYLVDNYEGEQETIVARVGDTVALGLYDLVVDATAADAFAFDGSTITIKSEDFAGNIKGTGTATATAINGAVISGDIADSNGDSSITVETPVGYDDDIKVYLDAASQQEGTSPVKTGTYFRYNSATLGGVTLYFDMFRADGLKLQGTHTVATSAGAYTVPLIAVNENIALGKLVAFSEAMQSMIEEGADGAQTFKASAVGTDYTHAKLAQISANNPQL